MARLPSPRFEVEPAPTFALVDTRLGRRADLVRWGGGREGRGEVKRSQETLAEALALTHSTEA